MDSVSKLLYYQTDCKVSHAEMVEARLFFFILAVALAVWAYQKIDNFFEFLFFEFTIYNIVDEVNGTGSVYQWYEIPIFTIMLILAYINKKKFKINYFSKIYD